MLSLSPYCQLVAVWIEEVKAPAAREAEDLAHDAATLRFDGGEGFKDKMLRADYPTTRIITGGEKLWAHQRARVEAAFDAPLHEQYVSREATIA